jgi:hypothetical protein
MGEVEMEANEARDSNALFPPFDLHHDDWGRLVLTDADGRQHVGVEVVRAFPLSTPRRFIAICDPKGRELLWLDGLDGLPPKLEEQIEIELSKREFLPMIQRIVKISSPVEPSEWEVETDRGRTFFMLDSEDDVHQMDGVRALITDAHGIRYLIPNIARLDAESRRLLERYL